MPPQLLRSLVNLFSSCYKPSWQLEILLTVFVIKPLLSPLAVCNEDCNRKVKTPHSTSRAPMSAHGLASLFLKCSDHSLVTRRTGITNLPRFLGLLSLCPSCSDFPHLCSLSPHLFSLPAVCLSFPFKQRLSILCLSWPWLPSACQSGQVIGNGIEIKHSCRSPQTTPTLKYRLTLELQNDVTDGRQAATNTRNGSSLG